MTRAPQGLDAWAESVSAVRARDAVDPVTLDVPADRWVDLVASAREQLGLTWFDALTVVDEGDGTFRVLIHLVQRGTPLSSLMLRTRIEGSPPRIGSVASLFEGASWHEREASEMFGLEIEGGADPRRLLLPDGFEGAPLRKDFALAPRAARPWPGAKDPGESDADVASSGSQGRRRRRRATPPGVPARAEDGTWES